jgi:Ca2+-binding EF-hand superfamily protein
MRRIVWLASLALVTLGMTLPVLAADKPKASPEDMFKRLDKNSDGKLTSDEFVGKQTGEKADKAKARFAKLDKDGDGSLTLDEYKAGSKKKDK